MSEQKRPPTPSWVKFLAGIFIALVLIFLVLHLMGRGFGGHDFSSHGSRPMSMSEEGTSTP